MLDTERILARNQAQGTSIVEIHSNLTEVVDEPNCSTRSRFDRIRIVHVFQFDARSRRILLSQCIHFCSVGNHFYSPLL